MPIADLIRSAISSAGLLNPQLSPHGRRDAILELAAQHGVSEDTVYRQFKRLQTGVPARCRRSDRGVTRALAPDVVHALHVMLARRQYGNATMKQLHSLLVTQFPAQVICYSTVCAECRRFQDNLPKAVSVPRKIEISGANTRWEMDLSKGDLFVADPRLNHGFPFRPQFIACEDACTRCCMYAQYTTTGRAVDVGAVLHSAILPKSDTWPQCGVPKEIGCDWGKVFVGEYFSAACAALGIETNPGHPYYPQDKGKLERFIGTVHHSFENTLCGWCTSNNRGDDALDPRKFFNKVGAQWIDPRFDRPLFTLTDLNALLGDWITGTYHRTVHSSLKCSPNDQWLLEMRGKEIQVPDRKYLEQQFLPWEWRRVKRGQVKLAEIAFQHQALAGVEGCNVQVRYLADDVSRVFIYFDGQRICEASPAPTYCLTSDNMNWKQWNEERKTNRDRLALRRSVLEELRTADIKLVETEDLFRANAADADPLVIAPPVERKVDPLTAGMSDEQIKDLQDLTVWGMPVLARGTGVSPVADDDFDEAEAVVKKLAFA